MPQTRSLFPMSLTSTAPNPIAQAQTPGDSLRRTHHQILFLPPKCIMNLTSYRPEKQSRSQTHSSLSRAPNRSPAATRAPRGSQSDLLTMYFQWPFTALRIKLTVLPRPGRLCTICALDTCLTSFPVTLPLLLGQASCLLAGAQTQHAHPCGVACKFPVPAPCQSLSSHISMTCSLPLWVFCLNMTSLEMPGIYWGNE